MFVVALVGADGAGKTTVARRAVEVLWTGGQPAVYLHMGENPDAGPLHSRVARVVWWTRRRRGIRPFGGPPPVEDEPPPSSVIARLRGKASGLGQLAVMVGEERARQRAARHWMERGSVVVCDRDFFADNYARVVSGTDRSFGQRLHAVVLTRWYRRPELMVVLDAPAALLLRRQGEGTIETLSSRRQEFLDLATANPTVQVVDADRDLDEVTAEVVGIIRAHRQPGAGR